MILIVASMIVFALACRYADWRVGLPLLAAAVFNFAAFDIFSALAPLTNDVVLWYATVDIITGFVLVLFGGRGFIPQTVLLIVASITHLFLYMDVLYGSNFIHDDYEAVIYGIAIAQMAWVWRGGYEHGLDILSSRGRDTGFSWDPHHKSGKIHKGGNGL